MKGKTMTDRQDLRVRFAEFHTENPKVYTKLVALAREAVAAGQRTVGIQMLLEVVRWHYFIETTDPEFKMNNDFGAFYARMIMEQEEGLAGIFNLRRSIADEPLDQAA